MCKWMKKHVDKFKKRATPSLFVSYALAKFLAGLGIGILLVTYYPTTAWNPWGWGILGIGIILGLYAASRICRK